METTQINNYVNKLKLAYRFGPENNGFLSYGPFIWFIQYGSKEFFIYEKILKKESITDEEKALIDPRIKEWQKEILPAWKKSLHRSKRNKALLLCSSVIILAVGTMFGASVCATVLSLLGVGTLLVIGLILCAIGMFELG